MERAILKREICPHCLAETEINPCYELDGEPATSCYNCGALFHPGWYRYVNEETAMKIIETREPRGRFVQDTGIEFVGIDNRDGDAWTEEFPDLAECLEWLAK